MKEKLLLARVATPERVPSDRKYIGEHLDAVAQHAHFRRSRVSPAHGNLHCAQSMVPRQVQQLGIKTEAFDALLLEDDAALFTAEHFEAALRIDKRQPQYDSNNLVENDASKFAERGFVHADQTAVHGARADGHIVVFQSLYELPGFFDRCGKVRVREKSNSTPRFLHAVTDAIAFASVHPIRNHA